MYVASAKRRKTGQPNPLRAPSSTSVWSGPEAPGRAGRRIPEKKPAKRLDEEWTCQSQNEKAQRNVELGMGLVRATHAEGAQKKAEPRFPTKAETPREVASEIAKDLASQIVGGRRNIA
jgi:hypothetical protein